MARTKILLVDDDDLIHQSFEVLFSQEYEITHAYNFIEAMDRLAESPVDFVFIDLHFKPTNQMGSQLLRTLKSSYPELPAIMISGDESIDRVVECMRIGADDYIPKPFTREAIQTVIQKLSKKNGSSTRISRNIDKNRILIGRSQSINEAKAIVAKSKSMRVLIVGDTGAGKLQ